MKTLILMISLLVVSSTEPTYADMGYVGSYYRKDGTHVKGHWKDTSHDGNKYNNRKNVLGY